MRNARIEQKGTPQEVYDAPASPFVIEFLGHVNRLKAGVNPLPVDDSDSDVLYVRPHDVEIHPDGQGNHQYALRAKVLHVFAAGNYGRVYLEREGSNEPFEAEISRTRLRELNISPGMSVSVIFRHVRLFAREGYRERDL